MLAIDTDSHSTEELTTLCFGIDVARRAWASADRVINCMSLAQLRKFIAQKRP
jgi:DNA polymerase (family 10)